MLAVLLSVLPLPAIAPAEFTTVRAVRSLSIATADTGRPVRLRGVVTFSPIRSSYFYLQDETGGVRVEWLANRNLTPGETVLVAGVTTGGTFLPEVRASLVLTTEEPCDECFPAPVPYTLAMDDAGYLDGTWVDIEAVVQRAWPYDGWLKLDLARGRGCAVAYVPQPMPAKVKEAEKLAGTVVRVRGVCRASTRDRQVAGAPQILVGDLGAIKVVRNRRDASDDPPIAVRALRVFRPDPLEARLPVRVVGVVTLNQGGTQLYVHDGANVVQVKLAEALGAKLGDRVSVVGFPGRPGELQLENARARITETAAPLPTARKITAAEVSSGRLEGHLVQISGLVHEVGVQGNRMTLTVVADGQTFTAVILDAAAATENPPAAPGYTVEVTGGVTRQPLAGIRRTAFTVGILPNGLKVLAVPPVPPPMPWWTGRRVAYLSAGFLGLFLLGGATVTALRVQVRRANSLARRQSEEKTQLESRLEQAARFEAVGLVAGGVAHDFNNILTVINGCAQLLDEELVADPIRAATLAADIRRAGRLAAALNALLLAFSRQRALVPHPLDVDAVIADAAPVLGRLLARGTAFRVVVSPALPPARAETGLLLQILINLTVNAGEAMPDGGTFTLATSAPEPGWVRITTTDSGAGMPPAVLARAFERGFTTKLAGTGTGLSTVAEAVRSLGGRVRVRSELGRGTEFEVDLPAAELPALLPRTEPADIGAARVDPRA